MELTDGAAVLREAAAKARELAQAASGIYPLTFHEQLGYVRDGAKQKHIAAWDPAVALAIADWWDVAALSWDPACGPTTQGPLVQRSFAAARVFLGRTP